MSNEDRCVTCDRLPVKSRRNTTCQSCGATVCTRCQMMHFEEEHAEADFAAASGEMR